MRYESTRQKLRSLYNASQENLLSAQTALDNVALIKASKSRVNIPIHAWKGAFEYTSDWVTLEDFSHTWTLDFEEFPIKFLPYVRYAILNKNQNMNELYVSDSYFVQVQDTDIDVIKKTRLIFGINVHPRLTWKYGRGGTPIGNMENLLRTFPVYISDEETGTESSLTDFQSKLIVKIINPEVFR